MKCPPLPRSQPTQFLFLSAMCYHFFIFSGWSPHSCAWSNFSQLSAGIEPSSSQCSAGPFRITWGHLSQPGLSFSVPASRGPSLAPCSSSPTLLQWPDCLLAQVWPHSLPALWDGTPLKTKYSIQRAAGLHETRFPERRHTQNDLSPCAGSSGPGLGAPFPAVPAAAGRGRPTNTRLSP